MQLQNKDVAISLIESYLNIRKESWNLTHFENDEDLKKLSANTLSKLSICQQAIAAINNAKSYEDWLGVVDLLYDLQRYEEKKQRDRFFIVRIVTNEPLVGHTLHATRCYLNSQLATEEKFVTQLTEYIERQNTLKTQLEEQNNNHNQDLTLNKQNILQEIRDLDIKLKARDIKDDYYNTFFNTKIKKLDDHTSALKENSFDEFVQSVSNNKRQLRLSNWLITVKLSTLSNVNNEYNENKGDNDNIENNVNINNNEDNENNENTNNQKDNENIENNENNDNLIMMNEELKELNSDKSNQSKEKSNRMPKGDISDLLIQEAGVDYGEYKQDAMNIKKDENNKVNLILQHKFTHFKNSANQSQRKHAQPKRFIDDYKNIYKQKHLGR